MPLEVFQGAFMGDADPAAAAAVHSVLRPQPFRTFTDPPADEAYRGLGIPLHYVLSESPTWPCRRVSSAGTGLLSGSRRPWSGCPAATSPCSPARPNWPTPSPGPPPAEVE